MMADLDLIIIGAGCAGLSLGMQLASMQSPPNTLLLEKRDAYENDRTWCFWGQHNTPFSHLAKFQWRQFTIQSEDQKTLINCSFAPYRMLSAEDFYTHAVNTIKKNKLLDLEMGITLFKEPEFYLGQWHLETSLGPLRTKAIVDTRSLPIEQLQQTTLWQSFLGYEVECEDSLFDPLTAQLMDFCKANDTNISFNYLLPLSDTKALIEFTVFAQRPYYQNELTDKLNASCIQYMKNKNYKILRTESGLIPMGLSNKEPAPKTQNSYHPSRTHNTNGSYVHAGLSAGAARPATGYAFQRIQAWALQCAKALKETGIPTRHLEDSFLLKKMDSIFLNVLKNNTRLGPQLFLQLFSNVNNKKLIRFLSDNANVLDYLVVVKALPAAPFIKELFKISHH